MVDFFLSGGQLMWLFLIIALLIIYLTIKKAIQLFSGQGLIPSYPRKWHKCDHILGINFRNTGIFCPLFRVYYAMQAIYRANDISPAIVAFGYSLSLITILTGLTIIYYFSNNLVYISLAFKTTFQ